MNLLFDQKFKWLIVEMERPELAALADLICDEHNQPELKGKNPNGILYRIVREKTRKKNPITAFLIVLLWIIIFGLVGLGTVKLLEILNSII